MSQDDKENIPSQGEQKPDEVKNLRSEMHRKQERVESELASIKQMLIEQAQAKQQQPVKQQQTEKPDPIIDPEGYERYIIEKVEARTNATVNQNNQRQSQLATLVQQFPELQDGNSDLTKKAVEYYSKLSQEEKMSPNAYKYAVQDAALDLGVVPMSKRKTDNFDDESFTGSSSGNAKRPSQKAKNDEKLDPATLAFAQAIGKDINDPKYLESLKKAASRKNWSKNQ